MALTMDHLAAYGIEQAVIETWKRRYGETLLPLQEQFFRTFPRLQGKHLLIMAPSASGKTFIAEVLALLTLRWKKRVLYLVPFEALAEGAYARFRETYGPLGIRTVLATRSLSFRDEGLAEVYARTLAEAVDLPPAEETIAELAGREETITRDRLIQLLRKGVGLHHADLPREARELVERAFRPGEIRLLCTTHASAMGLTLPAKNVILDVKRWRRVRPFQELGLSDITKGEYEGLSGRAGRFGLVEGFGRAILVTPSSFEALAWKGFYLEGRGEKLTPALSQADLGLPVLHLIASGFCRTLQEVKTFFRSTFTGSTFWQGENEAGKLEGAIAEAIGLLMKERLIFRDDRGRLHPTAPGRVAAQHGITVETCLMMLRWLDEAIPSRISELEILLLLALTEDGQAVSLPLTEAGRQGDRYRRHLRQEVLEAGEEGKQLFQRFLRGAGGVADEEQANRKVLLLFRWIRPVETSELERQFETPSGAIRRVGEAFSWLARTLAALARTRGWPQATAVEAEAAAGEEPSIAQPGLDAMEESMLDRLVRLRVLTREEADLILKTRFLGQPLRGFLPEPDRRAYDRLIKRRQRAEARIRGFLEHLRRKWARELGLDPREVSLPEVIERLQRCRSRRSASFFLSDLWQRGT